MNPAPTMTTQYFAFGSGRFGHPSQARGISERQAFAEFGKKKIEPLLNLILKREQYHPTWTNLMRWILKNK